MTTPTRIRRKPLIMSKMAIVDIIYST